jgi:hypothetical protein
MVILLRADVPPIPPSQITIQCPYCTQRFHLNYSNAERDRVASLVQAAQNAIREDHQYRSHSDAIDLNWLSS